MVGTVLAGAESPWAWEARPDVWLLIAGLAVGYRWAVTKLRLRLPGPPAPPSKATVSRFAVGLGVLWVAVDWPLDRLGDDYLFSAHMVQFLIVTMVAAPLFVTGIPVWLQRELTSPLGSSFRHLTRAPVALATFQVVLVATHLPAVVALYTSNEIVHLVLHGLWVLSAYLFWLPILGRAPLVTPLGDGAKAVYLIAATFVPSVPAGFLTWAETPLYDSYAEATPRVWGLSAIEDLQLAGAITKVGGGIILWGFILWVFIRWGTRESVRPSGPVRGHISPTTDRQDHSRPASGRSS